MRHSIFAAESEYRRERDSRMLPAGLSRRRFLALLSGAAAAGAFLRSAAGKTPMQETPALEGAVAAGRLPPVGARAPLDPLVVDFAAEGKSLGRPGGVLRLLMADPRDTRLMGVYGYARLVCFDAAYRIVPDIARSVEVEGDRIFTFHLRRGMRWSDGQPFTSDDFRYFWVDVANDRALSPWGLPRALLAGGAPPRVEFPDAYTVRYGWAAPNPNFLPLLAAAMALQIYLPKHYLKQFHARYADPARLAALVASLGLRNWAALHTLKSHVYKNDNPDLPTLEPWRLVTRPPAPRFVFTRNPYYHRFDPAGRQLPYIDTVTMDIVYANLIPLKTESGGSDLQARYLEFDDYTFLKMGERGNGYRVRLWHSGSGAQLALYPNLNVADASWRAVVRDVRFRRALSLAIDRHEINKVVYFGLGIEGNNTALPQSPLFSRADQREWASFDPAEANRLLDAMGLTARDGRGLRLLPDGRAIEIVVETASRATSESDVLALIKSDWARIGVGCVVQPVELELLRERVAAGTALMCIAGGLDDGIPVADMSPAELAPTNEDQLQWPAWGNWYDSEGRAGRPPSLPAARRLLALEEAWNASTSAAERAGIWRQMLEINADRQYSIGLVADVPQPVAAADRLRNLPEKGIYCWDPGAQFGIYKPDSFWLEEGAKGASQNASLSNEITSPRSFPRKRKPAFNQRRSAPGPRLSSG